MCPTHFVIRHAWAFRDPVKKENAPNYYEVIKRPTNLTAIKKKLTEGTIQTTLEFHREMLLLFTNAMIFNPHYHEVHVMAVDMCNYFEELVHNLEDQELAENPSLQSLVATSILAGLREEEEAEEVGPSRFIII